MLDFLAHPVHCMVRQPGQRMKPANVSTAKDTPSCDMARKYVRLLERRPDGLVSFEFSIGWPELAVELMLPVTAFDEFCATNQVVWRED